MKDRRQEHGTFVVVYNASDVTNYKISDERIVSGNSYIFRVKAKYLNGFTAYSPESLPVYACLPPMYLDPIRLVSVNQTQMTFEWSQPKFTGSCDV
jgi:hypothetical protein